MNRPALRLSLRSVAVLVAALAVIDPAVTSVRSAKARVAVVPARRASDSVLARRVARSLDKRFAVVDAPLSVADATVLVGETLPEQFRELASPVFVVRDDSTRDNVRIETVRVPRSSPLDADVPVTVVTRTLGSRGRTLDVTLSAGGVVVDRTRRPIESDRSQLTVSLAPTAVGTVPIRVIARIDGSRDSAIADVVTDIRPVRWSVLFFDPRPSWMSTFVRRAIERDPRFVVTSRVVTSRNVSTDVGTPPARLDDLGITSRFDAIVVGSPAALADPEIAGLDDYARKRGGSIVLLHDGEPSTKMWRLTQVQLWTIQRRRLPLPIIARATGPASIDTLLRASELAWATPLPRTAEVLASTAAVGDSAANRPVLWRSPLGAGRVIVSSALDSWRYRDRAQAAFDKLWQSLLADASAASPPAIDVRASPAPVLPGDNVDIDATVRDAALRHLDSRRDTVRASVVAQIVGPNSSVIPVRLWPTAIGEFHTTIRAPHATGFYRVVVTSRGLSANAPFVVAKDVSRATPSDNDLLESFAASRRGRVIPAAELEMLAPAIASVVRPGGRAQTWHPMRSPWWILPFAFALGGEWLMRRRAGLS